MPGRFASVPGQIPRRILPVLSFGAGLRFILASSATRCARLFAFPLPPPLLLYYRICHFAFFPVARVLAGAHIRPAPSCALWFRRLYFEDSSRGCRRFAVFLSEHARRSSRPPRATSPSHQQTNFSSFQLSTNKMGICQFVSGTIASKFVQAWGCIFE